MLAAKRNTSATMATNSMDHPRGSACTAEFGMAGCLPANVGSIVASSGLNNYNSYKLVVSHYFVDQVMSGRSAGRRGRSQQTHCSIPVVQGLIALVAWVVICHP